MGPVMLSMVVVAVGAGTPDAAVCLLASGSSVLGILVLSQHSKLIQWLGLDHRTRMVQLLGIVPRIQEYMLTQHNTTQRCIVRWSPYPGIQCEVFDKAARHRSAGLIGKNLTSLLLQPC